MERTMQAIEERWCKITDKADEKEGGEIGDAINFLLARQFLLFEAILVLYERGDFK